MPRHLGGLVVITVLSTGIVWLPFLLRAILPLWNLDFTSGLQTVASNFDGPNYLIVAKTWYDHNLIRFNFSNPLPLEYYPAHLPLYPALIALADIFLPGPAAMLIVTLLGSVAAIVMYYWYLRDLKIKSAFFTCLLFLFLPARFLVVRSVGSPEPWFIFFIIAALFFYRRRQYLWTALFGVLAQWTKSPGILLFAGLALHYLYEHKPENLKKITSVWFKKIIHAWPLALIPLSVIPLFLFYQFRTGDFWAYFNSGDNFHLFFPPFSIFSPQGQFWVGEYWLEDIIYIWLIFGFGVIRLWQKQLKSEAIFASIFYLSTLFVAHRDVSRYILPIAPLVLLGFADEFNKPAFKWLFALILIPVYLFGWNFILHNTAPVADWTPYL